MGDEAGRTQNGNNNAYCHDNEQSWFDWDLVKQNAEIHRFVSSLTARRHLRDIRPELDRLNLIQLIQRSKFVWHGTKLNQPDWGYTSHSLALTCYNSTEDFILHWILNAYWEPLEFELPVLPEPWMRWIDTSLKSPDDITDWKNTPEIYGYSYYAQPRSTVVLLSKIKLNKL